MDYNTDAPADAFFLVNTSGKVIDSKSKNKMVMIITMLFRRVARL